ncbi:hypothetical protein GF354_01650 [Candidatus Peregrinibacteria bacterium]|nr:hypothetical protein [Candidatus Peregrinibacteria bacterium]
MKKILLLIAILIALPTSICSAASSSDMEATVQIASYDVNNSFASGTGFFVSSMGTVLTNTDVIWDSNTNSPRENITIYTWNQADGSLNAAYTMEVWAYDRAYDMALLSPKNTFDDQGYVLDGYIGFNNSLDTPYLTLNSYSPSNGDSLEYLSYEDTSLNSQASILSTTVSSFDSNYLTTSASTQLMSSGGPVFYNGEAVGLKLEGSDVIRSEYIFDWFQVLNSDLTLTQPFIEVTFGSDYNNLLNGSDDVDDVDDVDDTVDAVDAVEETTVTDTSVSVPQSTTVDTTDYSYLPQEAQDFIVSIQTFVREGQATMDGELMKMSDLSSREQSLYPSDVVNPLLYAHMDPEAVNVTGFPDVGMDHPNRDAIFGLANMGIIKGYPDGTFKPDGDINRAELTKMVTLMRVVTIPQVEDYNNCFPDVASEWFAPYVCYAKNVGWIQGYPDGTFKPAQNVNRAEALKIILNAWFYETGVIPGLNNGVAYPADADTNEWYYEFLNYALQDDILDLQHASYDNGFQYFVGNNMTRKEVAETLARLLQK